LQVFPKAVLCGKGGDGRGKRRCSAEFIPAASFTDQEIPALLFDLIEEIN
jgi:hypothetical protein